MRTSKVIIHHIGQSLLSLENERLERRRRTFRLAAMGLLALAALVCCQPEIKSLAVRFAGLSLAALR